MKDIAPELYEAIKNDFERFYENDRTIQRILKKIDNGEADYEDAYYYSSAVGKCASRAFSANISEETLPDGKMYYNIAQRTVRPILESMENIIRENTNRIQDSLNERAGLGLKHV